MSAYLKRVFHVTAFFLMLVVLLASQCSAGDETPLSPEEELRRASDPTYAAFQKIKEELQPIPGIAKLKQVVEQIPNMSDDQLDKVLAYAERTKQQVMTKKKHLDGLLEVQAKVINAVALRWAVHTVRMWQAARKHERRLEEINNREYEAFRKKYPVEYLNPRKDEENKAK